MLARLGAEYWRARAAEAEDLAKLVTDADSKWRMQRIAADYEKLAPERAFDPLSLTRPRRA